MNRRIEGFGLIAQDAGASRCILRLDKKQPTLPFNSELRVKFGLKMWTNEIQLGIKG